MTRTIWNASLLSTSILLALTGCSDSEKTDTAPIANDIEIMEAKQWVPVTGTLPASDVDGDFMYAKIYGVNGERLHAKSGVFTLSEGTLELTKNGRGELINFSYTPITGKPESFGYSVTSNELTANAEIKIQNVTFDPLANEQWHLRNTGQKAYALSDSFKQYMVNVVTDFFGDDELGKATVENIWAEEEAKLVPGEDINVMGAYAQGVTGEGAITVVVDSGLEIRHEDLAPNVLPGRSLNLVEGSLDYTDPTSTSVTGDHGTSVAGIVASKGWNGLGGRGVAPDAGLIGMNLLAGGLVPQAGLLAYGMPGSGISRADNIVAFNRSYGYSSIEAYSYSEFEEELVRYPVMNLRNGKGALNVWSNGNSFLGRGSTISGIICGELDSGLSCGNSSFYSEKATPFGINAAAINTDGRHTSYSTAGSSVFVAAPAGEFGQFAPAIITTDPMTCLSGRSGFQSPSFFGYTEEEAQMVYPFNYPGHPDNPSCNYQSTMNGTSSAAPNTSGVVALIVSANPSLTWRDIKHILASTSTQNDPSNEEITLAVGEGESFVAHQGWVENAAGFKFNNLYGFGRVNAGEAVKMAKAYAVDLGDFETSEWIGAGSVVDEEPLALTIPDNSAAGATYEVEIDTDIVLEAIQFKFDVANAELTPEMFNSLWTPEPVLSMAPSDLAIEVTSPAGTRSVILTSRQGLPFAAVNSNTFDFSFGYILKDSVMLSNAFYGESAKGKWTIKLLDTGGSDISSSGLTLKNNAVPSVLEGVALRTFGHQVAAQ